MSWDDLAQANEESRRAWDENAAFWDERMGEGNDFVEVLSWPPTERMLALEAGERVLDIACGNGLTSRRMAAMGAEVVATDFSEEMIAHARRRSTPSGSFQSPNNPVVSTWNSPIRSNPRSPAEPICNQA